MKMKLTMMSFSMIFLSIFLKSNIQKKPRLLIGFRNQEMISKLIKISPVRAGPTFLLANKTEKRMRSLI